MQMEGFYGPHGPVSLARLDINPKWLTHPLRRSEVEERGVFQMSYLTRIPGHNKFTLD